MTRPLPRRTVLRGLGVTLALPLLEAMRPARALAVRPPVRLAMLYVPNGVHMPDWTPPGEGAALQLSRTLQPLAAVKDHLLVLTGLAQDNARALGDGPGEHARALATFLTGEHPVKTEGVNIRAGVSVDQVAAAQIGSLTRLPSIELAIERAAQSGSCDPGYSCAYSSSLSWKTPSLPLPGEVDPAAVFDRLFGSGVDARKDRRRLSVLDFVAQELRSLEPRVGVSDRRKLDEYLTSVRELEGRIARAQSLPRVRAPGLLRPSGVPRDFGEHVRLMSDLLVTAFRADLTRVATLLLANAGSNRSYPELEIDDGHHDLSHHGRDADKQEKIARIDRFHVSLLAHLLEKLKAVREGDGTLLDQSMIVYGSGISDGDRHNHDNLPVLLAGGGGGTLRPGRHLQCARTPLNNLFLSLLDRMNAPVDRLGDSTGRLTGLEG